MHLHSVDKAMPMQIVVKNTLYTQTFAVFVLKIDVLVFDPFSEYLHGRSLILSTDIPEAWTGELFPTHQKNLVHWKRLYSLICAIFVKIFSCAMEFVQAIIVNKT